MELRTKRFIKLYIKNTSIMLGGCLAIATFVYVMGVLPIAYGLALIAALFASIIGWLTYTITRTELDIAEAREQRIMDRLSRDS